MKNLKIEFLEEGIFHLENASLSYDTYVVPRDSRTLAANMYIQDKYCVYCLVDSDEGRKDKRKIYIGQTTDFKGRMNDHNAKKKWWNSVIVFCAPYTKFSMSIIAGLEKLLIDKYSAYPHLYDLTNSRPSETIVEGNCHDLLVTIEEILIFLRYGFDYIVFVPDCAGIKNSEPRMSKRSPFKFSMCNIKPGEHIQLIRNPELEIVVNDDTSVRYNGKVYSLSSLAKELLGLSSNPQGPICFVYNGEILDEIRKKFEKN